MTIPPSPVNKPLTLVALERHGARYRAAFQNGAGGPDWLTVSSAEFYELAEEHAGRRTSGRSGPQYVYQEYDHG